MPDTPPEPTPAAPESSAPPSADAPPSAGPAPSQDGEPDYKALYEQTLAKLTRTEQTARTHRDKARKYDEIEAAQQTELEKAASRAETAEQQAAQLRRRTVEAEIRAAATEWADPSDAPRYLDDRDRYLTDDGEIDTDIIRTDLAAVLANRPHLARPQGPRRPAPDPSQGAHPGGQLGLDGQITAAQQAGDWRTSTRLKAQRALQLAQQQTSPRPAP